MKTIIKCRLHTVLFVLSWFLTPNNVKAQYVTIPDTNFVNWLDTSGYSGCLNGNQLDTTCAAVLNASSLYCYAVPIRDLTGVQYFINLNYLDCSNDSLSFIPSLPPNLTNLNCNFNQLSSLPVLPPTLVVLYCNVNQLLSLPQLPPSLTYLEFFGNQVSVLPVLPSNLQELNFSENNVTNLPDSLPASLNNLVFDLNRVSSLPAIWPDTLTVLSFSSNLVSQVPTLPSSLNLFYCSGNTITNLPSLPAGLHYLRCGDNKLTTIPTLPAPLILFECYNNLLDSLPVLPDSLNELDCSGNLLTVLPSLPNSLNNLYCQYNSLTSIPSLPDSLNTFYCYNNPALSCLPQLKKIVYFDLDSTAITCLPNYGGVDTFISHVNIMPPPICDIINPGGCGIYWNISGEVYYDANADCLFDSTDAGQEYVKMQLTAGGFQQQVYSGYGGGYSFVGADNINYTLRPDTTNLPFIIRCPNDGYLNAVITAADSFLSFGNNFALQCRTDGIDVGVHSIINNNITPRPATNFTLFTTAGDISELYGARCAVGVSGQIQLIYTGEVTYHGVANGAVAPTSVSGNTVTWTITDFGTIDDYSAFNTLFTIDTNAAAGTQVCFTVHATTTASDYNPANNTGYFCFTIVDALDPNEKEVSPAGNIDTAQWLTYTIRFQNTGSAPAQNIRITDTLDSHLDPSTFQLTAFSAKNITQLSANAVVFNFPNINLADSLTSDSASRGYVQYKIKPKGSLQPGTQIQNTADIYFDLNPAVVTNTTTNTISNNTAIRAISPDNNGLTINLYPNPAKDYTILETDVLAVGAIIQISDITGKEVLRMQVSNIRTAIPISGLADGLYLVRLNDDKGRSAVKKLVVD